MQTILRKAETKWRDINVEQPKYGIHFFAMTSHGERAAIADGRWFGYTLTDCTHPAQNAHLGIDRILAWRFARTQDEIEEQFTKVYIPIAGKDYQKTPFLRRIISHILKYLP